MNKTFIVFNFKRKNDSFVDEEFESYINTKKIDNFNLFSLKSKRYLNTELRSGVGIWDQNRKFTVFTEKIEIPRNSINFSAIILFKVDQVNNFLTKNLKHQIKPDPEISPQSHYANERINSLYKAENNGFLIKGKNYFSSEIIKYNLPIY